MYMTMPATPMAATASAFVSQGMPKRLPRATSTRPTMTTADDHMSVEKWIASASKAWLSYFSAALFRRRTREIHDDRDTHDDEGPDGRSNLDLGAKEKPPACFVNDPHTGDQQQQRFEKRRKILYFAVSIGVFPVRRAARDAHGEEGDGRRDQVQGRVGSLRQNTQAAGGNPNHEFHGGQEHGRQHGTQGYQSFFAIAMLFQCDASLLKCSRPWVSSSVNHHC